MKNVHNNKMVYQLKAYFFACICWNNWKFFTQKPNLPSILQLTELLLFLDELRDICEWLWLCECDGLDSAERRVVGGCKMGPAANGLGVTVTIGWTEPVRKINETNKTERKKTDEKII